MVDLSDALHRAGVPVRFASALAAACHQYQINTPLRMAAFIGQCSHESGGFRTLNENLNYSAQGLRNTWPSRFPDDATANAYARQPEKIANKVYGGRMGNGPEASGDGWRYHGRGLIQLTGKANYQAAGAALGVDLVANPDLAATPKYAALTAGWYWDTHKLNALADKQDNTAITKAINGSTLGLIDRQRRISDLLEKLQ
ncbi:glycoside hydrolase family 19 protein [Rivihabitans pingtungensis]|uniref:Putative chitinase n=1 Tax=Rivihabitans pingtungensis TaxID=1054498 RepID=A0A318KNG8_9NEIS|nr:glycoside hydrolase family 19 protein [Rivihabitans pingtungensis]PXX79160.1 putative chitinase [Rivihabitans pingtungensis]